MELLLQARIRGCDGQSRRSALQHTARVCLKASQLRVPLSLRVCALSRRTFMNNAGLVGTPHHCCEWAILPNHPHEIHEVCMVTRNSSRRAETFLLSGSRPPEACGERPPSPLVERSCAKRPNPHRNDTADDRFTGVGDVAGARFSARLEARSVRRRFSSDRSRVRLWNWPTTYPRDCAAG